MKIIASTNIKISREVFNDVYLPQLENYSTRFNIFYGGAGSGKSHFVFQKMVFKYLKYAGRKCLVVRKINNTLKDSCFEMVKTVLSDWQISEQCKINKTDLTIMLPNGSIFLFKGLDDNEKIKSIANIDDIVCEEITELDSFDFTQLNLRLRSPNGMNQIHCMFNPVSKENWVFGMWFNESDSSPLENLEDTMILKTTYEHNKFLPEEYKKSLLDMKRTNPAYYEIYANGEFATLDKLIYTNWEVKSFDYRQILKEYTGSLAVFGTDFGYVNDPTAFTAVVIDEPSRQLWYFDEFAEKGLLNDQIATKIIEMGYGKEIVVCDSAEPKSIDDLKRYGLRRAVGAIKGRDSIINGIDTMQAFKIYIHPSCTLVLEELKNYTWKKNRITGEYMNEPIDRYNHCLDSMRYGINYHIKGKRGTIKFRNRREFGI